MLMEEDGEAARIPAKSNRWEDEGMLVPVDPR